MASRLDCGKERPSHFALRWQAQRLWGLDRFEVLHSSRIAVVQDLAIFAERRVRSGSCPSFLLGLPYQGVFAYEVGSRRHIFDANRLLFASPHQDYVEDHPVAGVGHASLLIQPAEDTLEEVCGGKPLQHDAFKALSAPSSPRLKLITQQLLTMGRGNSSFEDETILSALTEALRSTTPTHRRNPRIISRAKEILHEGDLQPISLDWVASQVGVSPVYLTQEFTRAEGIPLYNYHLRLRLSRALLKLPCCESITDLALELNFSSHSHFTAAFRRNFGITPSQYREERRRVLVYASNAASRAAEGATVARAPV